MLGEQTTLHPQRHAVRRILYAVLASSSKFDAFCIDHFQSINAQFSNGMDREAKTNLLLTYATPEQILQQPRSAHPKAVAQYAELLDESTQQSSLEMRQELLSRRLALLLTERDTLRKYKADCGQLDSEIEKAQRDLRHGAHLNAGEVLADRYQLIRLLAEGSFAQVWVARNLSPDDTVPANVAVKVLHGNLSHDRTCLNRFVRGSQQMRRLQHPDIVRVYLDASQYQGFHFFVMELLPDGDLHAAVLSENEPAQRPPMSEVAVQLGRLRRLLLARRRSWPLWFAVTASMLVAAAIPLYVRYSHLPSLSEVKAHALARTLHALNNSELSIKLLAVRAIGNSGNISYFSQLDAVFDKGNPELDATTAKATSLIGALEIAPKLVGKLEKGDLPLRIRLAFADALRRLRDPAGRELLRDLLMKPGIEQQQAARVLIEFGDRSGAGVLHLHL